MSSTESGDKATQNPRIAIGVALPKVWRKSPSILVLGEDDIVYLLKGAPKPIIIQLCEDYFTVIRITASAEEKLTKSGNVELSELL